MCTRIFECSASKRLAESIDWNSTLYATPGSISCIRRTRTGSFITRMNLRPEKPRKQGPHELLRTGGCRLVVSTIQCQIHRTPTRGRCWWRDQGQSRGSGRAWQRTAEASERVSPRGRHPLTAPTTSWLVLPAGKTATWALGVDGMGMTSEQSTRRFGLWPRTASLAMARSNFLTIVSWSAVCVQMIRNGLS